MHVDWFVVHVYVYTLATTKSSTKTKERTRYSVQEERTQPHQGSMGNLLHNVCVYVYYIHRIYLFFIGMVLTLRCGAGAAMRIFTFVRSIARTLKRVRDTWRHVVNEYILFSYTTRACGIFREIICAN